MPPAKNIAEVIAQLEEIVAWCVQHQSRQGYFAALYHRTTVAVQQGINKGLFADGPRMDKLDTIFANLYVQAWHCYNHGKPCSQSWQTAFDACKQNNLAVIQHMLLGVNTHINLDLAIAAAQMAPGSAIEGMHGDFVKINEVIASLVGTMYDRLCRIWLPLRMLGRITQNSHEAVVNFSIVKAREASWANALLLAYAGDNAARDQCIDVIDHTVTKVAGGIIWPGRYTSFLLKTVQWMEPKQPGDIIQLLQAN
ncbi:MULTISPECIES: DUF5995 family protein [Chitinophagaceae]|uniref:DUF5995 family protein n=1 Tax=Chitinophagaceae TaxID=563835 RepID=UPI000F50D0BB|nr:MULTISPECIES: DUF5995 family protein [Chitinophagaceae]RPD43853.1 hypothetical protein DRJ53_18900 [Paracnuella aquatica]